MTPMRTLALGALLTLATGIRLVGQDPLTLTRGWSIDRLTSPSPSIRSSAASRSQASSSSSSIAPRVPRDRRWGSTRDAHR